MRLSRLFGRANQPDPSAQTEEAATEPEERAPGPDDAADESPNESAEEIPEGDLDLDLDREWRARAVDVIPGGASTGSKRAEGLFGEGTGFGPTHYVRASGCHLVTPGGRTLIDCTMSLGSVTLGYADETLTRAVVQAAADGHVAGLSHTSEVEIAERLCDVIPCAEHVRFLKSGAEAVSAAVRIARVYTGRRAVIAVGYFGWHDWATDADGVPPGARADVTRVPFDDVSAMEHACERLREDLAAVVIEPVIEKLPSRDWLEATRRMCDAYGAVLIFDEIKTGFRLRPGGYQEYGRFEPDLATFGKAMANGYPIAAVVGRAAVMEAATRTWISSTLAGETTALAAVAAVLHAHEQTDVCDRLWATGEAMMSALEQAIAASRVPGVTVAGIAPMWFLRFDDPRRESRFLELALEEGVLFKRGPYNFASLAHDEATIIDIERAASTALVQLAEESGA